MENTVTPTQTTTKKHPLIGSTKCTTEGRTVEILNVFPMAGSYEGKDCDLLRVRYSNGKTAVIEKPTLEK